jgi:mRNA interferase HigB
MRVVGRLLLNEFVQAHTDVRSAVLAWLAEMEEAEWVSPLELKARYPSASLVGDNQVVFNLKGNRYRVLTSISFQNQLVYVERIGTHADYDRWQL